MTKEQIYFSLYDYEEDIILVNMSWDEVANYYNKKTGTPISCATNDAVENNTIIGMIMIHIDNEFTVIMQKKIYTPYVSI